VNIVRLGHYHIPSGAGEKGACQWATVIKVVADDATRAVVNLRVIDGDGDDFRHLDVKQDDAYAGIERGEATFHLSDECPWGR
jgi:predicted TPR repeat methyltransferase